MARVEVETTHEALPETVKAALLDFTARRPEIWPALSPRHYEVLETGPAHTLVREGQDRPDIWALERYEWSGDRIRWTVVESNFCTPGSFVEATVGPGRHGGSLIRVVWERHGTGLLTSLMMKLIVLSRGRPVLASLRKGLDNAVRMGL